MSAGKRYFYSLVLRILQNLEQITAQRLSAAPKEKWENPWIQ
jgi:hypothetical protein